MSAYDRTPPGTAPETGTPSWHDYLDFRALARRPVWLPALALTAFAYAVMPVVYVALFGVEGVSQGVIRDIERALGVQIGGDAAVAIEDALAQRSWAARGLVTATCTAAGIALAGLLLTIGGVLLDLRLTQAQALAVAAVSWLAGVGARVVFFVVATVVLGLGDAARIDWIHVAQVDLAVLADADTHPVLRTLLGMFELARGVEVAIAAVGLRTMDPRADWCSTLFAAFGWTLMVAFIRLVCSAIFNVAII